MKILYYLKILRPVNVLITGLSVFLGAVICGRIEENLVPILFAVISAGMVAGGGNVINDYFDVEIDKINKPNKLIISKIISPKVALRYYFFLILISQIFASFVSIEGIVLVTFANILMFFYSYRLKGTVIWGNITVALVSGLAFIYGGLSVGMIRGAYIPAIFALFFHFGREILKDIEDVKGDKAMNAITLPIKYGKHFSAELVSVVFVVLILLTFMPYVFGIYNMAYLVLVIFGVDLGLLYLVFIIRKPLSKDKLHLINNLLKLQMLMGIISIYIGSR